MTVLRFRLAELSPSLAVIAKLRGITQLAISDIRSRAADGTPILEISAFRDDWEHRRALLVELLNGISNGSLPLIACEVIDNNESPLSLEMLRNLIQHFRQIEVETQMETELELGEISDPNDFEPFDDDWTK